MLIIRASLEKGKKKENRNLVDDDVSNDDDDDAIELYENTDELKEEGVKVGDLYLQPH